MSEHTDVGAYSMGLLEERDKQAFEDHLATCPVCAAELAELASMAALFRGVEPVGPGPEEPAGAQVTELIQRRVRQQRQRRRWQVALGAAAGIVLIGGGVGVGIAAAPNRGTAPPPVVAGQALSATDPVTGVAGTVHLVAKAWGTQVTLDLSRVHGPVECQLVAVSKAGERRVVMGWVVPAPGDGVPGHPAHLMIQGGTSIPRGDLAQLDVNVVNGRTLLTIPV